MDYRIQIRTLLPILVVTVDTGTSFLLSDYQCTGPSNICPCSYREIDCRSKHLTDIPLIVKNFTPCHDDFVIKLDNNDIVSLPSHAFEKVSFTCANSSDAYFSLNIRDNKISYIDPDAFVGIEYAVRALFLESNGLQALPTALGKLFHLETLNLAGNPLASLDSSVLSQLDSSLEALGFDMDQFRTWQFNLNSLTLLESLAIMYIPFSHLSLDAFNSLSRLKTLKISYSKLEVIPKTVCNLQNLEYFQFDSNTALINNHSIFPTCSTPLSKLTTLHLYNNSLSYFPDVLKDLPSIGLLSLERNNIHFIPDDVIPNSHGLKVLRLNKNQITRIPHSINRLANLTVLALHDNKIATIESNDFLTLPQLNRLFLGGNPVEYIAFDAFKNLKNIDTLDLTNISLPLLPKAVLNLPRLRYFSYDDNEAECSCRLSYLKGWNITGVEQFSGNCKNNPSKSIKTFITNDLQQCP